MTQRHTSDSETLFVSRKMPNLNVTHRQSIFLSTLIIQVTSSYFHPCWIHLHFEINHRVTSTEACNLPSAEKTRSKELNAIQIDSLTRKHRSGKIARKLPQLFHSVTTLRTLFLFFKRTKWKKRGEKYVTLSLSLFLRWISSLLISIDYIVQNLQDTGLLRILAGRTIVSSIHTRNIVITRTIGKRAALNRYKINRGKDWRVGSGRENGRIPAGLCILQPRCGQAVNAKQQLLISNSLVKCLRSACT